MTGTVLCACDQCHSRKIRCDRQPRCANCADTGTDCRRTRPQRSSRLRSSMSTSTPGEKLLRLERTAAPLEEAVEESRRVNEHDQNDQTHPKRRKLHHAHLANDVSDSSRSQCTTILSPDDSSHHAEQARVIIQSELEGNDGMNSERQSILRSALGLVNTLATGRTSNFEDKPLLEVPEGDGCEDMAQSLAPTPELLYMLLRGPEAASGTGHSIQWPDHISEKTLQKMAAAFFSGKAEGQLFYQYCVCIYVKGIYHAYQMPRIQRNPHIAQQALKSKKFYEIMALRAVRNLNFLNTPSVPFIQALISSAFLMQYMGNMSQAWLLNSYAARLLTALNFHETRTPIQDFDTNEEAYSSLYWCYYLDRTLSALLARPVSLPALQISPMDLINPEAKIPHLPLLRVIMSLAQVQGELLGCRKLAGSRQEAISSHSNLQERMVSIHTTLETSRVSVPKVLSTDWVAVDFCYYAILVDILRSRLRYVFSPMTHKECVSYSRKSLEALQYLQKHIPETPGFADPFPSFFTWTLFLYPLSPFFVLFCNIIADLNMDDYNLMQDIIQNMSQFKTSPYIAKLLKLLGSLQNICTPLIQNKTRMGPQKNTVTWIPAAPRQHTEDRSSLHQVSPSDSALNLNSQLRTPTESTPASSEDLMWQLFNTQVSMEWFDSDLFALDGNLNFGAHNN